MKGVRKSVRKGPGLTTVIIEFSRKSVLLKGSLTHHGICNR